MRWRGCAVICLLLVLSLFGRSGKADELRFEQAISQGSEDAATSAASEATAASEAAAASEIVLRGRDDRWQLLLTLQSSDLSLRDVTSEASYAAEPAGIIEIGPGAVVKPLAPGMATVRAVLSNGLTAARTVRVEPLDIDSPVNFPNQIVPIFTKHSCNGGGCHGKLAGQNGFRLSLLGFEPKDDYEFLVRESRGRRLFPAAPERSLLLTKGTAQVPHGGGARLQVDSHEYRLLSRWIAQGMPYGSDSDPMVTEILVTPSARVMARGGKQQLQVVARYSDGRVEDVTQTVQYESNDPEMAEVSTTGLVSTRELAGDVSIMMRYQGHVAVFRASLPLSDQPPTLPEPRNNLDRAVFAQLQKLGIPAADKASDGEFLRRLALDLTGRLPTLEEVDTFARETDAEKRDRWIERYLTSEDHAAFFASKWSQILRNRRDNEAFKFGSFALHNWLRDQLYQNRPYDQIVREIVAASGDLTVHPPVAWYRQVSDIHQQVEDTAQLFLGQRIQCARCHHHPFEKWSQRDYGQLAAFFSLVSKKKGPSAEEPFVFSRIGVPSSPNPRGGAALSPAGLGAPPAAIDPATDPRQQLVDWMVDRSNPFFAPSLVNRYWKHFFGRGLVDPEDDMRVTNPASNPELLSVLSEEFRQSGFDLRQLLRTIVQSEIYQRTSLANELNLKDKRNHSRFYPKRLQAEVLLDVVDTVLGTTTKFAGVPAGTRAVSLPDTSFDSYFLTVFGRPQSSTACECEREMNPNLAQSLHLLNSKEMQGKLTAETGRAARYAQELVDLPEPELRERVAKQLDDIYRIALARSPAAHESSPLIDHICGSTDRRAAIEDVLWAIINSKEFLFNH